MYKRCTVPHGLALAGDFLLAGARVFADSDESLGTNRRTRLQYMKVGESRHKFQRLLCSTTEVAQVNFADFDEVGASSNTSQQGHTNTRADVRFTANAIEPPPEFGRTTIHT
jgi:hypothetical protein